MVTFCDELISFLQEKDGCLSPTAVGISESELEKFKVEVYKLFDDYCSVVYIPAGRSMITLLSQQFSYIYATNDDFDRLLDLQNTDEESVVF